MAVSASIYEEQDSLRTPFAVSVALHGILAAAMIFLPALIGLKHGDSWGGSTSGGGGEAMSATLVSSIPLPAQPNAKPENVLAVESKGLTQSQPKPVEKAPDAIPIPDRNAKQKPVNPKEKPVTQTQKTPPRTMARVEENRIPFGEGGPVSGPYGVFNAAGAKGGFGFTGTGSGAGGDFGSRYAWYVDAVRRKVAENWMKYEVDPRVSTARRVYIYFEITRPGSPANIRVEQSSWVPSLDQSATRALQRIDTFGPLPGDYHGNRVSVEFWFDYRR